MTATTKHLDEYIDHLAGESGAGTTTDEGLISLAATARRAIALRESVYRATDIDQFDGEGIPFPSRCALRFGSTRQTPDEARLPERSEQPCRRQRRAIMPSGGSRVAA